MLVHRVKGATDDRIASHLKKLMTPVYQARLPGDMVARLLHAGHERLGHVVELTVEQLLATWLTPHGKKTPRNRLQRVERTVEVVADWGYVLGEPLPTDIRCAFTQASEANRLLSTRFGRRRIKVPCGHCRRPKIYDLETYLRVASRGTAPYICSCDVHTPSGNVALREDTVTGTHVVQRLITGFRKF